VKISAKAREKYAWFLSLGRDEPRRLSPIAKHTEGISALDAFHTHESTGRLPATSEPAVLESLLTGKEVHGITVRAVAEDFVGRVAHSAEIRAAYPAWVAGEIFAQAKRIARQTIGFVPSFVANGRDFSEA
jgi:hypothetical protein